MIIQIGIEELEEEFRDGFKLNRLVGVSIDYATNAMHAWYNDKEYIIFRFKDYGFIQDNRRNNYFLSIGSAGILIKIVKSPG